MRSASRSRSISTCPPAAKAPTWSPSVSSSGGMALAINGTIANGGRIAIAKVGALSGEIPNHPVSATINGRNSGALQLFLSQADGILYAFRSPLIFIVE